MILLLFILKNLKLRTPNIVFFSSKKHKVLGYGSVRDFFLKKKQSSGYGSVPGNLCFFQKKQSFGVRNRTPKLCVFSEKKSQVRFRTPKLCFFEKNTKFWGTVPFTETLCFFRKKQSPGYETDYRNKNSKILPPPKFKFGQLSYKIKKLSNRLVGGARTKFSGRFRSKFLFHISMVIKLAQGKIMLNS